MKQIKFKYKDERSQGEWRTQECLVDSLEECKKIYGLGIDSTCEYQIISVKDAAVCPRCHKEYVEHPAISRDDNKTEICPSCGLREAMEAFCKEKGIDGDA